MSERTERRGRYIAIVRDPATGVFEYDPIATKLANEATVWAEEADLRVCAAIGHSWVPSPFDPRYEFCDLCDAARRTPVEEQEAAR